MGIGLHVAGDLITSFGTMIFWPLSDWRAGLGTTFIVDLWFSGIILAGLVASWAWRRSRLPAIAASVALLAYVGFQGVLKHQALEFAQRHARASGLEDASLRAEPRPVSPFNWTVYVTSGDVHRFAHVNLRREAPRAVSPQDGFIARLDAPYLPLAQARWESATRFGNDAEARLAREAWASPALASFRWFAEVPAYDGTTQGSTCVWFRDLRFEAPGRGDPPFRYGACRDTGTSPWRAFMRVGETGRRALD
jgi:inner membrane protein